MNNHNMTTNCEGCDGVTNHEAVGPCPMEDDVIIVECQECGLQDHAMIVSETQKEWLLSDG